MSDLSNCGCGCDNNVNGCGCGRGDCGCGCGFGNNSCLWIILLLICCGGCGNGFGHGGEIIRTAAKQVQGKSGNSFYTTMNSHFFQPILFNPK